VSELAEESELRDLFERFGRVTRVFLARDRETQRAKGFAFISFADRTDAARACEKMDGCTFPSPLASSFVLSCEIQSLISFLLCSWLPSFDSPRRVRKEGDLDTCFLISFHGTWVFSSGRARFMTRDLPPFSLYCMTRSIMMIIKRHASCGLLARGARSLDTKKSYRFRGFIFSPFSSEWKRTKMRKVVIVSNPEVEITF
jgi:RNA recognition motif-containing protein